MNKNLFAAIAALAVSVAMYVASTTGDAGGGFEFPALMALVMCALGAGMLAYAVGPGRQSTTGDSGSVPWGRVLPGLVLFVAYLFLIEWLGFFVTSFLAFLAIALLYAPGSHTIPAVARIAGVAVAFMATLYAVFVLLLQVQFPQGVFF